MYVPSVCEQCLSFRNPKLDVSAFWLLPHLSWFLTYYTLPCLVFKYLRQQSADNGFS